MGSRMYQEFQKYGYIESTFVNFTTAAAVPEPSTLAGAATGILIGLGSWWWHRRKRWSELEMRLDRGPRHDSQATARRSISTAT
jgi:hypothetical protein